MDRTYLERVADRVGECSLGRGDRAAEQEGGRSRRCIIDMYECQHDSEIAFHIFDRTPPPSDRQHVVVSAYVQAFKPPNVSPCNTNKAQ